MAEPRSEIRVATMVGASVRLDTMALDDAPELLRAAGEPATFEWFTRPPTAWDVGGMRRYCANLIDDPTIVPFTVREVGTGEVVGSTTFCDIQPAHRGIEIGWTFFAPSRRGTVVNPETKWLMLRCAFDTPLFVPAVPGRADPGPALRVMLKTGHSNERSQRAIEKLGASKDGVLRNHIVMPDGSLRHTVVYSITPDQWPAVEARLRERLEF